MPRTIHVAVKDGHTMNSILKATNKPLSTGEIAALRHAADGLSDHQIAERMKIAQTTAHRHVENARRKLGASSRPEAIATAAGLGILKRP